MCVPWVAQEVSLCLISGVSLSVHVLSRSRALASAPVNVRPGVFTQMQGK